MSAKTFLKFSHTMDVYQRTTSTNAAGQQTVTFSKAATISAQFQSVTSERRIEPYIVNIDEYEFYVSYQDTTYITYSNRIENVKDRYGNIIEAGPLEITNIQKYVGLGGRLHHLLVGTRRVVENA